MLFCMGQLLFFVVKNGAEKGNETWRNLLRMLYQKHWSWDKLNACSSSLIAKAHPISFVWAAVRIRPYLICVKLSSRENGTERVGVEWQLHSKWLWLKSHREGLRITGCVMEDTRTHIVLLPLRWATSGLKKPGRWVKPRMCNHCASVGSFDRCVCVCVCGII